MSGDARGIAEAYERLGRYLRGWSDFPEAELAKARRVFRPVSVRRGELLVRAGDRYDRVGFIVRGLVRLVYVNEQGVERTLAFRAEDELVCAYAATVRDEPSDLSIEALEPGSLLSAARPAYQELCAGHPCWREMTARLTEALYVRQERRQRELLLDDATTRYQSFLRENPALAGRLTQRQIASYVGVTPVALSRIRARLISVNDSGAPGS